MNPHPTKTTKTGTAIVGLALACAFGAALGCTDSSGSPTGTGGSGAGTAGTAGRGGTTGRGGATGTAGTGGSASGTAGSGAGGGTAGTGTGGGTAGTGGGTAGAGTGGMASGGRAGGGTAGSSTGGSGGGGTGGAGAQGPANLPSTLNPPAGATLKLSLHATGDQIYTCTASAGGAGGGGGGGATTYSYVLKQPDAKLFDASNTQVGTHGLGPNWTSTVDNSVVNGARAYQENAPLSDAIPWLLLRATSNTGTGVFSDITYVIRANTTGGKAPATGCDSTTAGTDTKVPYTADYFFYNGGGPGTAWMTPPANLPTAIVVPSGSAFKIHDHAIGVQVYTCTPSTGAGGGGGGAGGAGGSGATTYSWVLKQPDAVLYDSSFTQVGTHGLGPNWTSTDGSVVNGARVNGSNVTGTIAWLLLQATSNTGTGVFSDITYVQRLNTAGGAAPATGCDATTSGTDTRIPYSADYYFFTGGNVDGGTGG
jgi:hypothetical protein